MPSQNQTLITKIATHGKSLISATLFPPTCPGCGQRVAIVGDICSLCWQSLRFITHPYCPIMGTPLSYDAGIKILSLEAIEKPPPFSRARAVLIHEGLSRRLITRLKYGDRTDLAPIMARWMIKSGKELLDQCDMVIPVPLHSWRFFGRRYNQAAELGRYIARFNQTMFFPQGLKRIRHTPQQVGLNAKARQANVHNAFTVPPKWQHVIHARRIVLVDDVYTTGATVKAASAALLKAQATKVDVLTFSKVVEFG